jgi:hypothetical protein
MSVELLCLLSLDTVRYSIDHPFPREAYTGAAKTVAAKAKRVIE